MYIPPGFGTVSPYIFADGAERLVTFLVEGLGGRETLRTLGPNGTIANSQVAIGNSTIMVSEAGGRFAPSRASFYLYVADSDAAMARAVAAGGKVILEVADMPYGDRQGGIEDLCGNIWWVSQRLVEEPYS